MKPTSRTQNIWKLRQLSDAARMRRADLVSVNENLQCALLAVRQHDDDLTVQAIVDRVGDRQALGRRHGRGCSTTECGDRECGVEPWVTSMAPHFAAPPAGGPRSPRRPARRAGGRRSSAAGRGPGRPLRQRPARPGPRGTPGLAPRCARPAPRCSRPPGLPWLPAAFTSGIPDFSARQGLRSGARRVSDDLMDTTRLAAAVELTGEPLAPAAILAVARFGAPVRIGEQAARAMAAGRAVVDTLADDVVPHYGISTGFGALARRHIPVERRVDLQRSLVRSHAAGTGPEVEREVVRALMLLRLATLATGRTGMRPATARCTPTCSPLGSPRWCGSSARSAARATSPRSPMWRSRLQGEGGCSTPTAARRPAAEALAAAGHHPGDAGREGGPGADQRHRRDARDARAGAGRPRPAADRSPTSPQP